tara:strand:+ start:491 stop:592 length:102 start_codon:yes stop_codon:yes gene_type:complete
LDIKKHTIMTKEQEAQEQVIREMMEEGMEILIG